MGQVLSRTEFAQRLGYIDISKAHKLLTTALMTGTVPPHMRIHLADALELDEAVVERAIQGHYRESKGRVPAFGEIVSYTLVTLPGYLVDFGFPFDNNGDPAGPMQTVARLGSATLGVKRGDTRLTGLLRNTPVGIVSA